MKAIRARGLLPLAALLVAAASVSAQDAFRQSGVLDRRDGALPDGRYVEWLRFNAAAGTRYLVSVESDDMDPYLILRFADGSLFENDDLDGWNAGVVYTSQRAESVEIGVTSNTTGETGDYTALARRLPAARAVQLGQTVTGNLATTAGGVAVDSYILNGARGDRVRLLLSSEAFDPVLRLQSRTGYTDENDDSGDGTESALSYLFLEQGQLEIQVRASDGTEQGAYELVVERRPAARTLQADRALTGRLSNDTEELVLEGRGGQMWEIEASSDDFDTVLMVSDRLGRKARNDDRPTGGTDSFVRWYFDADGSAVVTVSRLESGSSAPFRVSASPVQPPEGMGGRTTELETDGSYPGYLDVGAERSGTKYRHLYTYQAGQNELVRLQLYSEDFDAYLEVTSPDGEMYSDDDGLEDYNSKLDIVGTTSGVYTVSVTTASDWSVGSYELVLERGGEVSSTLDVEGVLETRDERDPSGRHFDVHLLEVEEGESFAVDLMSDDFDAYLYVWSPGGKEILSDDDGGGDTSARVEVGDASGGTWTIYATSNSEGETGSYRLRASQY